MNHISVWFAQRIMELHGRMVRISVPTRLFGIFKMPGNAFNFLASQVAWISLRNPGSTTRR